MISGFLEIPTSQWVASNGLAFAVRDIHPVTEGHTLVITRRIVTDWFQATHAERLAVFELIDVVKAQLDETFSPSGYNVGFNVGAAGGQTVPHLHVHVIPRYDGDCDDPRGGVRHALPGRGNYKRADVDWSKPPGPNAPRTTRTQPLTTGEPDRHLGRFLGPLFGRSEDILVIAAFVQESGLDYLRDGFDRVLQHGGRLRLLTGDYLHITQASALTRLVGLMKRATAFSEEDDQDDALTFKGRLEVRVIESEQIRRSFHPKAWIFRWSPFGGVAYVGSSNLSRSALRGGIEWNLRLERDRDPNAWTEVVRAAEALWNQGRLLDADWVSDYETRAKREDRPLPPGDVEDERDPTPTPRDVQVEALEALRDARQAGQQRALVVMATGLGKTFLAAFDVAAFATDIERTPKVLFLAHRREILTQAEATFARVQPELRFSWCLGATSDLTGDVVFASVQKMSRPAQLRALRDVRFDYVIVDEVHHATAHTYRAVIRAVTPGFLLGLTATPDRADEADVQGLFDDHVPYRADLALGISRGLLVPFDYQGLRDTVDYAPIPWRSGRFSTKHLANAVQTEQRMQTLWNAWSRLPGSRTLVFCVSIRHARFVRDWLRNRGLRVEAVHSAQDSFDRESALEMLEDGQLDALCTVDLFNEGIDCRPIDRVVMLRPTESPVLFLQQLGRGLRTAKGKERLQVIDFVGNHRVFLNRLRTLLSLTNERTDIRSYLEKKVSPDLPAGCSVRLEMEGVELLRKLLPSHSKNGLIRRYRELRDARGHRPTAGELHRMGLNPTSVSTSHGGWFGFVNDEGDLTPDEQAALATASHWFAEIERISTKQWFKLIVLEVLVEKDALADGVPTDKLAQECHAFLRRSPELLADLQDVDTLDDVRNPNPAAWLRYWMDGPVRAWTTPRKRSEQTWFRVERERFVPRLPQPKGDSARVAFEHMTTELVDWRISHYRKRLSAERAVHEAGALSLFRGKVTHGISGDPILLFGNRKAHDARPWGETDIRLEDGSVWQFRFVKIACNVARPVGVQRNQLPDLLRRWFGPSAGMNGTDFHVEFRRSPDGWWAAPVGANVVALPVRGSVTTFPDLRAAAGALRAEGRFQIDEGDATEVRLPVARPDPDVFAVRADGNSMNGRSRPVHHGDWVLLRLARSRGLGAVEGRVALVSVRDEMEGVQFLLKRVARTERGVVLRSDNPAFPEIPVSADIQVIALLADVIRPADLAPAPGTILDDREVASQFGVTEPPTAPWSRVDGHLFILVDQPNMLDAPDRLQVQRLTARAGETAFVLTRAKKRWRYAGIAQWLPDEEHWSVPAVDFDTWRALGKGRSASRRLDDIWLEQARAFAERASARSGDWISALGKSCRIAGRSVRGGLRIDGGPGGFKERTISLTDLAWVLAARDKCRELGTPVDEAQVNRLRYLDGTPKGSTRWIDTGWALVLTAGVGGG